MLIFFLMFFFFNVCVCVFFFLRQECLGMPELQRAAEFFFSAGSILK